MSSTSFGADRASTTIGVRDRERANMVLRRLDGVGVEASADRQASLEHPVDEPSRRHLGKFGAAHLVEERPEAASPEDLQALE